MRRIEKKAGFKKIVETVEGVRRDFELGRVDKGLLARLYNEYNPVPNVDLFIERAIGMYPALACGVASVYLRHVFQSGQIEQGRYKGMDHTFLLLGEDLLVDITADQFGGPKVHVGGVVAPWELRSAKAVRDDRRRRAIRTAHR